MSLLRRIDNMKSREVLRHLLEKLMQADDLKPQIEQLLEAAITEQNVTLSDAERQQLSVNPVNYLLGVTPPPATAPAPAPQSAPEINTEDAKHIVDRTFTEFKSRFRPQTANMRGAENLLKEILDKVFAEENKALENPLPHAVKKHLSELLIAMIDEEYGLRAKDEAFLELKRRVSHSLLSELDPSFDLTKAREHIEELFHAILNEQNTVLSRAEKHRLLDAIMADILGLGPLDPLLADDAITDILVLGAKNIFVTRMGHREKVNLVFDDEEHVLRIIDRIVAPLGKRCDESSPMISGRLRDGSRFTVIARPASLSGPTIKIYKFQHRLLSAADIVRFGTITPDALEFLRACVLSEQNILVYGDEQTGKNTLLNVLCGYIPDYEFIVVAGDGIDLQLNQEEVAYFQSRPANIERRGETTVQELVKHALRMRPDRLVVEETYGGELQDYTHSSVSWLTAVNTLGYRDVLKRLEVIYQMNAKDLPVTAVRSVLASSVEILVHIARLRDGSRKVLSISEMVGETDDKYVVNKLFAYEFNPARTKGHFRRTDAQPSESLLESLTTYQVYDNDLRSKMQKLFT